MGNQVLGLPGVRADKEAAARKILASLDGALFLAGGGGLINGALSRDVGNTGNLDILRAGLLMGRITSGGKYAPAVIGVLTAAYADGETEVTVGLVTAAEIVRRIGATGDLMVTGPASAGTAVSSATKAYSAVDLATGVITIADMDDDFIAGSWVQDSDGSEIPVTIITDQWGLKVTDENGDNMIAPFPQILIAGQIDASQIINYTSDAAMKAYIKAKLRLGGIGWVFDDDLIG